MIEYKDATDLKEKKDKKYFNFSEMFKFKSTYFKCLKTTEELTSYISESVEKTIKDIKDIKDIQGFEITEGTLTVVFTRVENENEYYKRKKQEELEYEQKLSTVEKQKHKAKEKIKAEFEYYSNLKKEFDGKTLEELLDF